jgi:glycosyltransferase involved in cell wall biosynthesis
MMTTRKTKSPAVSVIVGLHNLGDGVPVLVDSLHTALRGIRVPFETVCVDDASTDDTWERLVALARKDDRLRLVRMRAAFGEAAALEAGFRRARGATILYLSGRVRVNPADLPRLVDRLRNGAPAPRAPMHAPLEHAPPVHAPLEHAPDLVVGRRSPRRDSRFNQAVSRVFNALVSKTTGVRVHDVNSGVFATRREVLERIAFYGDLIDFLPVMAVQQGYRIGEETVEQLPGTFRQSKYPREYLQRLLDILTVFFLTRYSKKPIHFMGFLGMAFAAAGLAIEGYLFVYRILGFGGIAGRPLLVLGALLLVLGIQMVSIGLIGEMIIFTHAGDIEGYNVEETIN